MLNSKMPYNDEMLAAIFRRPINTVRLALTTFENFGMVEIINNTYTIPNWEKHQNVDKMSEIKEQTRKRVAKHREKQKLLNGNVTGNVTVTQCNAIEKERDKEKEKESHSFIHADKKTAKREFSGGTLGEGIVFMSDDQFEDLCDKLSLDEIEHYFEIIKDCERKGKKFTKKTHYQAILDMVAKDRRVAK